MADNNVASYQSEKNSRSQPEQKQPEMAFYKVLQRYIPIVIVNLILIVVLGYFISPLSEVETVSVEGNEAVYIQQVIDESGIRGGDSVIDTMQNKEALQTEVTNQLPQISETSIELSGFNDVVITVNEFDTVAYITQDGSYLRVLENGDVLDDVYDVSIGNQPVLSNFSEGEALNLMIDELSQLDTPILRLISEIELAENRSNPLFIQVYMNNGNRALASIPTFSEKISYYPQMVQAVEGRQGVFDMEAGVYFIPFAEDAETDEDAETIESDRQALEEFNG